jgi:hypothetical protein
MLVTARPSLAPGVFAAAAAPLLIVLSSWLLVPWAGGSETLSRLIGASGAFGPLVIISGLVELAFLSMMLCHLSIGRVVPVTVLLGVATLPWTMGLLGTEVIVGRTVAALSTLEVSDARATLALGVGEAMASRVLGAWMSAALLGGLGLGLHLAWASGEVTLVSRRGHAVGLLFGGLTAFALAAIAVVGVVEAYQLFELLTRLEQVPVAERMPLLVRAADEVARLQPVRWGSTGLLVALVLVSVWKSRRAAQAERDWTESAILLAAVAALLVLDGHPLRSALQGGRAAGLVPVLLPEGFQPLRTTRTGKPHPLMARATPEGLRLASGLHLPWSTPARTLAGTFVTALHSADADAAAPLGINPEPQLSLLADTRLSGAALQRLIEASTHAGAHSVELVGHQPDAPRPTVMAGLERRFPFFALLAARPGALRLLLPSALPYATTPSWRARFDGKGLLHLSPAQGSGSLTLSLHATPAEVPEVLAGAFVGLELSRDVSLKQLGAAVEVLGLAGASPVVMLGSDAGRAPSSLGGTRTVQSAARRGGLTPELLYRVAQTQLHALKSLRRVEASRRQALALSAFVVPASSAQSIQMNSAMPRMNPRPSTSIMKNPSRLDDWGTFGTASGPEGFTPPAVTGAALEGRAPEWVTTEASRSSSPSRASASTRFMWSM